MELKLSEQTKRAISIIYKGLSPKLSYREIDDSPPMGISDRMLNHWYEGRYREMNRTVDAIESLAFNRYVGQLATAWHKPKKRKKRYNKRGPGGKSDGR